MAGRFPSTPRQMPASGPAYPIPGLGATTNRSGTLVTPGSTQVPFTMINSNFYRIPIQVYPPMMYSAPCSASDQQKWMEEQRQHAEKKRKEREYHMQQQRLRELGTHGNQKLDAEVLMESMIGKMEKSKGYLTGDGSQGAEHRGPDSYPRLAHTSSDGSSLLAHSIVGKSRDWRDTTDLNNVFTNTSEFPNWLTVPEFYSVIENAITRNNVLDGHLLLCLVASSGLGREMLAQLWNLTVEPTGGQITRQGLYALLALIAMAQGGYRPLSLGALHNLLQPPIPLLQVETLTTPSAFNPMSVSGTKFAPAVVRHPEPNDGEDDFDDFKSAPIPTAESKTIISSNKQATVGTSPLCLASSNVGSRLANYGSEPLGQIKTGHPKVTLEPELAVEDNEEFSDFQQAETPKLAPTSGNTFISLAPSQPSQLPSPSSMSHHQERSTLLGTSPTSYTAAKLETVQVFCTRHANDDLMAVHEDKYSAFRELERDMSTVSPRDDEDQSADLFSKPNSLSMTSCNTNISLPQPQISYSQEFGASPQVHHNTEVPTQSKMNGLVVSGTPMDTFPIMESLHHNPVETPSDEFGEFVSCDTVLAEVSSGSQASKDSLSVESQSVSSLELGVLDTTVVVDAFGGGVPQRVGSVQSLDLRAIGSDLDDGHSPSPTSLSGREDATIPSMLSSEPSLPWNDKYSIINNEIPTREIDRLTSDWQRCLDSCMELISNTVAVFDRVQSKAISKEVVASKEGQDYFTNILEVYRVACRIRYSMKNAGLQHEGLWKTWSNIGDLWSRLQAFFSTSTCKLDDECLDFSSGVLPFDVDDFLCHACGVCLLDVNSWSKANDHKLDGVKLAYGGREYHSTCANFWINCVNSLLPAIPFPHHG